MPTTTNSRFLAIGNNEPNINTGWTIRVLDYRDMKTLVAVISEFSAFSFTQELSGTGTGSITLDEDSPFWTSILENGNSNRSLLNREYVFEAWDNNTPRFAWLGQTVTNTIVGEDETRAVQISGPGIAQVLTWGKVWRPGWPTPVPIIGQIPSVAKPGTMIDLYRETSYNDSLSAGLWGFPLDWPTMRMWYTVFRASQRRGLLRFVTLMFSATQDSAKKNFQLVKTVETLANGEGFQPPEMDQNLLDFLNDCTGQDYSKWFGQRLEWLMYPGFKLDVRQTIGTDRSKTVRFFQGNILSDERTRDREAIFNRICAQDVDGNESNRTDNVSVGRWNMREQWNTTQKNITDDGLRNQIADRLLAQSRDEKDQWTIKIPYDDPGRVPYRNFFVGDYVGVNVDYLGNTPTAVAAPTKYRIMAITVSVSADATVPECEITFQSIIDSRQIELQKQILQLVNNPRNVKLDDLANTNTTSATEGSTLVWNPDTKRWEAAPGSSGSGGNRVFFGPIDPAADASLNVAPGDFWFQTA